MNSRSNAQLTLHRNFPIVSIDDVFHNLGSQTSAPALPALRCRSKEAVAYLRGHTSSRVCHHDMKGDSNRFFFGRDLDVTSTRDLGDRIVNKVIECVEQPPFIGYDFGQLVKGGWLNRHALLIGPPAQCLHHFLDDVFQSARRKLWWRTESLHAIGDLLYPVLYPT